MAGLALLVGAVVLCLGGCIRAFVQPTPSPANPSRPVVWVNSFKSLPPRVDHFAFASAAMGHNVGVTVHRPAHNQPAPVIYFLHGRGGDETTDMPAFLSLLRGVLRQYQLPEPLVVLPNGGLTGYRGPMATMIVDELMPYIDQHYSTRPERRFRLVAGFSMGGAGAVRLAIQYPEAFGGAASWGGGMRDTTLLALVDQQAPLYQAQNVRFLLVNGEHDRPEAFLPLADLLQRQGIGYERIVMEDVNHDMGKYLSRSRDLYARHLLALWQ